MIYPKIPMIAARTTGAQSPTKIQKNVIVVLTAIILHQVGKKEKKNVVKMIQSVILNPLTAIK